MITLTRLSGTVFVLNSDLIERVDATPDTVITLVDGKKYVVCESLDQVAAEVRNFRGQIVALGSMLTPADLLPAQPAETPAATHAEPRRLAAVAPHREA